MTVSAKLPLVSLPVFLNDSWPLLNELLHAVADEIYLLSVTDMQLIYANASALNNTGCDLVGLQKQTLSDVLGVSEATLQAHLQAHGNETNFLRLMQDRAPAIGRVSHELLRVKMINVAQSPFLLLIKSDLSPISGSDCHECEHAFNQVLMDSESRVEAIISNTPGLVFQLQLDISGDLTQLPPGIFTDVAQAQGRIVNISMGAGTVLRQEMLKASPVVQQGQTVMLTSSGKGFRVSAEGKAMTKANEGQVVQVKVTSGQVISGIARAGGQVEVVF